MLLRERVNWEEARVRCHRFAQSRGAVGEGDLAVVDDMDTFKTFVADTDFRECPAGAHFAFQDGFSFFSFYLFFFLGCLCGST